MPTLGIVIIVLVVLIVVFVLLRELNCWYWKINERITLMNEQNDLLRKLTAGYGSQGKIDVNTIPVKPLSSKEAHLSADSNSNEDLSPKSDTLILNQEETELVNSKMKELKENEIIVIHPLSRVIKRIHKMDYSEGRGWVILEEFGK